jgi:hypothetical protein
LAVVVFIDGIAYGCDGFVMGMARHDQFRGIDGVKVHFKDLGAMSKYLKSHSGQDVKIHKSSKATFLEFENGAIYGFMDLPHQYPVQITQKFAHSFDMIPSRVWTLDKNEVSTALGFLEAGSDSDDTSCDFSDPVDALTSSPKIQTVSSRTNKTINYSLSALDTEVVLPENTDLKDYDFSSIPDLGRRMAIGHKVKSASEEITSDLDAFTFNSQMLKRIVDTFKDEVHLGAEAEDANRGYCLFKQTTESSAEVVVVMGFKR